MKQLIVVVGADGRQDSSVINALLEYPDDWHIRGITGDMTSYHSQEFVRRGVDMVECDINNREECSRAFAGAYGVFAMTYFWTATDHDEYRQAIGLVEAARTAHIQHFITSGLPDTVDLPTSQQDFPLYPISKSQVQKYLRQLSSHSIFPHITFIHVGFYYQNFTTFFVSDSIRLEFRYPNLSNNRIPLYDICDTGNVVRECFRQPEKWGNGQVVPVVAEQLTMGEICDTIREIIAKEVHFIPLSYEEALLRLPREVVNNLKWYGDSDTVDEPYAGRTKIIWPKMNTFANWLRENQWIME